MKTCQFVTTRTLLDKGYRFHSWLAGYHVYRLIGQYQIDYLVHDFLKQEVVSTFKSYQ